jgi:glycosyltransferase involved in cell wall biosynthesis
MDRPKVTALLPCYNAEAFIGRTLDSLAAQTWPNLEILIGDDCSTDATLAVVRGFAEGRENVRILERTANLGWLKNTNDLMRNATGDLMFFAFHDDRVAPTYVEKLVAALEADPAAVMAFSDMERTELDGTLKVWVFDALDGLATARARGLVMASRPTGWWVPNRGLFRREAFAAIGGIRPNERGEISADWTWLLHMALLGGFVRVPEVLCEKFYMKQSLSRGWTYNMEQERALRRAGRREVRLSRLPAADKTAVLWRLWQPDLARPFQAVARRVRRVAGRLEGTGR